MTDHTMANMDATLQMTAAALAKPAPFSHPTIYDAEDPDTIHAVDRDLGGYVTVEAYDNLLIAYEELKAENDELKEIVKPGWIVVGMSVDMASRLPALDSRLPALIAGPGWAIVHGRIRAALARYEKGTVERR